MAPLSTISSELVTRMNTVPKLILWPNSCNLFQTEGSALLALIVGDKMNALRLQLIKLATRFAFLASFIDISVIDTLNSMID